MFQIFVKIPGGGATLTLDVEPFDTGMDLKILIFERIGIQPRHLWLSARGHVLEDWHQLGDRGVERETTVTCNLRLGGGPCDVCMENMGRNGRTYLFFAP